MRPGPLGAVPIENHRTRATKPFRVVSYLWVVGRAGERVQCPSPAHSGLDSEGPPYA